MKYADYQGQFHGFTLKPGYFYGQDTETGNYIATSGWETAGNVGIYFLEIGKWVLHWVDAESDFCLGNLPEISTDGKMSFVKWLEIEQGISPVEWDENYSDEEARQIEEEYDRYYYDGLPQFAIKNLRRKSK